MNPTYIPTPQDSNLQIENAITKTADFAGTAFDFGAGFAPGGAGQPMNAVVDVSTFALGGTTGASAWTGQLFESSDNITYSACGPIVTISSAAVLSIPGIVSQRYVKLGLDISGATGTGTLGLSAWLNPNGFAAAR